MVATVGHGGQLRPARSRVGEVEDVEVADVQGAGQVGAAEVVELAVEVLELAPGPLDGQVLEAGVLVVGDVVLPDFLGAEDLARPAAVGGVAAGPEDVLAVGGEAGVGDAAVGGAVLGWHVGYACPAGGRGVGVGAARRGAAGLLGVEAAEGVELAAHDLALALGVALGLRLVGVCPRDRGEGTRGGYGGAVGGASRLVTALVHGRDLVEVGLASVHAPVAVGRGRERRAVEPVVRATLRVRAVDVVAGQVRLGVVCPVETYARLGGRRREAPR